MDALHAAIKAKRAQKPGLMDAPEEAQPQEESTGMAELLAKLSAEQKEELKCLLAGDESEGEGQEVAGSKIAKGAASSEEKARIEERIAEDGEGGYPEGESDEIAKSMVDRRHADQGAAGVKPKGLGERAKMAAAGKLRAKGKI